MNIQKYYLCLTKFITILSKLAETAEERVFFLLFINMLFNVDEMVMIAWKSLQSINIVTQK